MNKTRYISSTVTASVLALSCAATWAARSFTPQAGTWAITEELDGKPGRGLAIDVQGNTFFMQVFGYAPNGDATFYTATGQLDGDSITVPLMQYQGGRSFGSDARDAEVLGSPGNVTVSFSNGLQGTVQFPGEPVRAMQRFEMRSNDYVSSYWEKGVRRSFLGTLLDADQNPHGFANISVYKASETLQWQVRIEGLQDAATQTLDCSRVVGKDEYHCTTGQASQSGGHTPLVQSMKLHIANVDLAGQVEVLNQGALQTYTLMGTAVSGGSVVTIGFCTSWADLYVGDMGHCTGPVRPSSGTWVAQDELTFNPGRGIAIDAQNGMALAQIFNYLPDGSPTFHMGSTSYQGVEASLALNRYEGGRTLGGPPASGELAEATGTLALTFRSGAFPQWVSSRVLGQVAFPNESPKPMVRMALEPCASDAQGLLGQWWLRFVADSNKRVVEAVTLSRVEADEAVSADGAVRCSRSNSQSPAQAICVWNRDGVAYKATLFQEANNRSAYSLQVRDRHGNLMGLGDVPLQ